MLTCHLDYEGRSGVDITDVGSYRWSVDPRFEIFMAAVSRDEPDAPIHLWINPMFRTPDEMGENDEAERILAEADVIYAHNAQNEVANTWGALEQGKACPFSVMPALEKFRCTAAMARKAGLPHALAQISETLQLTEPKDREGKALIRFFCIPDEETGRFNEPRDHPEKWNKFCNYCRQDVRAEKEVGRRLKPFELTGAALATFQFDLRMNHRGIPINLPAARHAQTVIDEVQAGVVQEFRQLTGLNPTQGKKFKEWLKHAMKVDLSDLQGPTVEAWLTSPDTAGNVKHVLELYQKVSYAAVKKVQVMLDCVCPDGFIRGMFMYYGAGTGRWCLTGDHEVLTPSGWQRLDQWKGGDIACWNEQETISFQRSRALSFAYQGTIYHQKSQRIDQLATGDHRCPGWDQTSGEFTVRLAKDLVSGFCIPYTGTREKSARGVNPDELRLLVATQADGHYTSDGALRFHFKRERKILRLRELLRRLDLKSSTGKNGDGSTTISIVARHLPMFLHLFRDKTFGAWLLDVNAEVFFEELELWDGYRAGPNSVQYTTVNTTNAEWIQALAHTSGMAVSRRIKKARGNWREAHILSIWLSPSNRNQLPARPTKIEYKGLVYCAATPTGFFLVRRNGTVWVTGNSAQKLQPHNFKKTPAWMRTKEDDITDAVYAAFCDGLPARYIDQLYGDPLEVLSGVIRNFIHLPGVEMFDGDYSGVEARIIAWLSGQEDAVQEWRDYDAKRGPSPYIIMAAYLYEKPQDQVTSDDREVGKRVKLGAQYQMGPDKFKEQCLKSYQLDLPMDLCVRGIQAFRKKNRKIVAYWYLLDNNAKDAVRYPGTTFGPFTVRRIAGRNFLLGRLPSGRALAFPDPKLEMIPWTPKNSSADTLDDEWSPKEAEVQYRENVTYWGEIRPNIWGRVKMYPGKWAENFTQAVATDFMACGSITAEARGMPPFMLVHDQGLALRTGSQTVKDYEDALGALPDWAAGFPMKVEAKITPWYKK